MTAHRPTGQRADGSPRRRAVPEGHPSCPARLPPESDAVPMEESTVGGPRETVGGPGEERPTRGCGEVARSRSSAMSRWQSRGFAACAVGSLGSGSEVTAAQNDSSSGSGPAPAGSPGIRSTAALGAGPDGSAPRQGSQLLSGASEGDETRTGSLTAVWPRRIGSFALPAESERPGEVTLRWSWPVGAVSG